tara:strand:+ start:192 stop:443 length:252 start_codon:yes stop_codon:yes gene_type:complete
MNNLKLERSPGYIECVSCNYKTYNKYDLICKNCMSWLHISDRIIECNENTPYNKSVTIIYTLDEWQTIAQKLLKDLNNVQKKY